MALMIPSTVGMLLFGVLVGLCYALMGWELRRKGRRTQYLSLSFDPRVRIRIARVVFEKYRQLMCEEGRIDWLPRLVWVSAALTVLFLILFVLALLT